MSNQEGSVDKSNEELQHEIDKMFKESLAIRRLLWNLRKELGQRLCPYQVGQIVTSQGGNKYIVDEIAPTTAYPYWKLMGRKVKKDGVTPFNAHPHHLYYTLV